MLLALATLAGCWRPAPYAPPAAEVVTADAAGPEIGEGEDAPGEDPARADAGDDEGPGDGEGAAPGNEGEDAAGDDAGDQGGDDDADEAGDDVGTPFASYAARTVQGPVTLVDDWGKPLAVLGTAGWKLEVRGEDTIRTRVWCGECAPPVEGWIQAHLLERTD